jgi:hypothetical protein
MPDHKIFMERREGNPFSAHQTMVYAKTVPWPRPQAGGKRLLIFGRFAQIDPARGFCEEAFQRR